MANYGVKPGRAGYKILFSENKVIMNYKFAAAAARYGSQEYKILKRIQKDFPGVQTVTVSGRERKFTAPNTRLTYANMEKYIMAYENAEELLSVFRTVKALSSPLASPYKYVSDWFKAQFPEYREVMVFQNGELSARPVDAPPVQNYRLKLNKAG